MFASHLKAWFLRGLDRSQKLNSLVKMTGFVTLLMIATNVWAVADLPLFGPERYERLKGKPTVYLDTFERCEPSDLALLRVWNGESKKTRIKAARLYVNGVKVATEKDFKSKVAYFEKLIPVKEVNELKVVLKSGHHGYMEQLEKYQEKKDSLERELTDLQALKEALGNQGKDVEPHELENTLLLARSLRKGLDERNEHLKDISGSLDQDDREDDEDESDDHHREIDDDWSGKEKIRLEKSRENIKEVLRRCEKELDRVSDENHDDDRSREKSEAKGREKEEGKDRDKDHDDDDHDKRKDSLEELIKELKAIDKAMAEALSRLAEIDSKIEMITAKGPSFLVIEIIGKNCDSAPPVISALEPADGALLMTAQPLIAATYADEVKGSGLDLASVRLTTDGRDVTSVATVTASGISYAPADKLPEGEHVVTLFVADRAFNGAERTWGFTTDTIAPVAQITSHQDGQYLTTPQIAVSGSVNEPVVAVTVNGSAAAVSGGGFSLAGVALSEGVNSLAIEATDLAGNVGTHSLVVNLDTAPPVIQVAAPQADAYLNTPQITVSGSVNEPVVAVTVNGSAAAVSGTGFSLAGVALSEGVNTLAIEVTDRAGNIGTHSLVVNLDTAPPVIQVAAPQTDSFVNTPEINISGSVNESVTALSVNGIALDPAAQSFSLAALTLSEGTNTLVVLATDRAGNSATTILSVTLDTLPPEVIISFPLSGLLTRIPQVAMAGTVNEPDLSVTVNGAVATVVGEDFTLAGALLAEGVNTLLAEAVDRAGNRGSASVSVTLDTLAPAPPVIDAAVSPTNLANLDLAGAAEVGSLVRIFAEVPGVGGLTLLGVAEAGAAGRFTLPNQTLAEGQVQGVRLDKRTNCWRQILGCSGSDLTKGLK